MALDYIIGVHNYGVLLRQLQVTPFGTPFSNVRHLKIPNVGVSFQMADMGYVQKSLERRLPVIAAVKTAQLSYWDESTNHAVVIVGVDADRIALNDPGIPTAPKFVALDEFELAWMENDYACAVLHHTDRKGVI